VRKVRRAAFLEVRIGHVDLIFRGGKVGLILFGEALAVGQRQRGVLRRAHGARRDQANYQGKSGESVRGLILLPHENVLKWRTK
jgi:hypothetical protein